MPGPQSRRGSLPGSPGFPADAAEQCGIQYQHARRLQQPAQQTRPFPPLRRQARRRVCHENGHLLFAHSQQGKPAGRLCFGILDTPLAVIPQRQGDVLPYLQVADQPPIFRHPADTAEWRGIERCAIQRDRTAIRRACAHRQIDYRAFFLPACQAYLPGLACLKGKGQASDFTAIHAGKLQDGRHLNTPAP